MFVLRPSMLTLFLCPARRAGWLSRRSQPDRRKQCARRRGKVSRDIRAIPQQRRRRLRSSEGSTLLSARIGGPARRCGCVRQILMACERDLGRSRGLRHRARRPATDRSHRSHGNGHIETTRATVKATGFQGQPFCIDWARSNPRALRALGEDLASEFWYGVTGRLSLVGRFTYFAIYESAI